MGRHSRRVGYGLPLLLAIALHLGLLVVSVIRFPSAEREPPNQAIVQATLVRAETATDRAQQADPTQAVEAARQAEEEAARRQQAEREAEADRQRQADAEREAALAEEREKARQAAEEAAAEAARRAEAAERQAALREQQEAERRRQEAEARRQREAEERRRREAEAERQRQAEEEARRQREAEERRRREAEARRQAEEEARRQREAEAQRRQEEAARRAAEAAQQSLDRAIAGEAEAVANARQAQEAANGFINLVRRAVEQAWVIPPNVRDGATAEVAVRLGPSGELFAARIGRSSGDGAFDRSALQAVESAAPFSELRELPASVQRQYREFNLRFRPGDIR